MINVPLIATWRSPDIPVCVGQRLLGLRTHTSNRTIYLYDHDGERPGWVSGDVIDAAGGKPSHDDVFVALVTHIDAKKYPEDGHQTGRFKVTLRRVEANAYNLRNTAPGWPDALGDDPDFLRRNYPQLVKLLETNDTISSTTKGTSMSKTSIASAVSDRAVRTLDANTKAFKGAAYLEAGTIANNQIAKLVAAKAPFMVRGYVDTPIGRVVLANLFQVAITEFRPDDAMLKSLTQAMMVEAHHEVIKSFDIAGLIDELLNMDSIKAALGKVGKAQEEAQ